LPLPSYLRSDGVEMVPADLLDLGDRAGGIDRLPLWFQSVWADRAKAAEEWRAYLSGRYVCLRSVRPDTIVRKDELVSAIAEALAGADGVVRGGYTLAESSTPIPQVILIGTGSEVSLCLTARDRLEAEGVGTRVVSMPCREWFDAQDRAYRDQVLPPAVAARVSVEAGIAMSWRDIVGPAGECVSIEHYGASAPYQVLFEQFGFTPDRVVAAAHASLAKAGVAVDGHLVDAAQRRVQGSIAGN